MKFIITLILLAFIVTLSFGYKQLCLEGKIKTCTLYMTNTETAYTNVFLPHIDPMLEISMDYEFGENKNSSQSYENVNELLLDEVNNETILSFLIKIDAPSKNATTINIVPDLSKVNGTQVDKEFPFIYSTQPTTTPIPTTPTTQKTAAPTTTQKPATTIPTTQRPTTQRQTTARTSRATASAGKALPRGRGIGYLLMGNNVKG